MTALIAAANVDVLRRFCSRRSRTYSDGVTYTCTDLRPVAVVIMVNNVNRDVRESKLFSINLLLRDATARSYGLVTKRLMADEKKDAGRGILLQARIAPEVFEAFDRLCSATMRTPSEVVREIVKIMAQATTPDEFNAAIARIAGAAKGPSVPPFLSSQQAAEQAAALNPYTKPPSAPSDRPKEAGKMKQKRG